MEEYYCNGTEHKFWLSYICTNGSDTTGYECYNTYYTQHQLGYIIRKGLGIWLILVGVIGGFGNLYTLISIPFAANRNKFGQYWPLPVHICPVKCGQDSSVLSPKDLLFSFSTLFPPTADQFDDVHVFSVVDLMIQTL